MKKIVSILIIQSLSVSFLLAIKIDGYILTKKNDSIKVTFEVPTILFTKKIQFLGIQNSITVYDKTNKKRKLLPTVVKEIGFIYNSEKIRMISKPDSLLSENEGYHTYSFYRIIVDGKMKLFNYYYRSYSPSINGTPSSSYVSKELLLEKGDDKLFNPRLILFKKDIKSYLSDCPILLKKIEDNVYGRDDLEQIVIE